MAVILTAIFIATLFYYRDQISIYLNVFTMILNSNYYKHHLNYFN